MLLHVNLASLAIGAERKADCPGVLLTRDRGGFAAWRMLTALTTLASNASE